MTDESSEHFLHRNGNRLGDKLNKKSNLNKVRHSINSHLKDALKIAVGIGKGQSLERTKNAQNIFTLKYTERRVETMLHKHPI
jgi:hypothetical protein